VIPTLFSVSYAGYWGQHRLGIVEFLEKAAALGYPAVEIGGKRPHLSPLDYPDAAALAPIRNAARRLNIEIATIAGYTDFTAGRHAAEVPFVEMQLAYVGALAQMGKALGAKVIAAASSEEKLAFCKELGADETIDYEKSDLRQRVLDLTGGKGADVVYDPVGGAHTEAALRATAWRGRLLVIGFASGVIPQVKLNLALLKERSLVGVYWGDWAQRDPHGQRRNVEQLVAWFAAKKIRPAVSERVRLEDAPAAMQRLLQRKVTGKVVVVPGL
jgi:NADPH-dependent curcumin reductase CurA